MLLLRSFRHLTKFLPQTVNKNIKFNGSKCSFTSSNSTDTFGVPIFEKPSFKRYIDAGLKAYQSNKAKVDSVMNDLLKNNKLVLFMEGTFDSPGSLCSLNIVKMFSALQITNVYTVDLLKNKEALGYLTTHLNEPSRAMLFKDGTPIGGHDELLQLFTNAKLLQALEIPKRKFADVSSDKLSEMLPIASY